ncbi:hypothetical protein ATO46_11385 [Aeromonas schubertii]|nr:hypothetical protein ATO46_11385 [Aeromonas schubertii]
MCDWQERHALWHAFKLQNGYIIKLISHYLVINPVNMVRRIGLYYFYLDAKVRYAAIFVTRLCSRMKKIGISPFSGA